MTRYRPFGTRCPMPVRDEQGGIIRTCGGLLRHEDWPDWVYIECPTCKTRWAKDHPSKKNEAAIRRFIRK